MTSMTAPPSRSDRETAVAVRVLPRGGGQALVVPLGEPHDVLSWAIVNGGRRRASHVVWREVRLQELGPEVDARALLTETLLDLGVPAAVGMLTARNVRCYDESVITRAEVRARAVATVGLGNALAAGDPPAAPLAAAGTINVLCQLSVSLSEEALVEACAVATEARTAAMLSRAIPSVLSGQLATGTGTDCIVIAAPTVRSTRHEFSGKHTACGSAVGASVREAVLRGVDRWLEENGCRQA